MLAAEQNYANSLDGLKFTLGLPPRIDVKINEDFLQPFELSNPKFDELRTETDSVYQRLVQFLPPEEPPRELLDTAMESYGELLSELETLIPEIEEELERWDQKLSEVDVDELNNEDQIDYQQQQSLIEGIKGQLTDVVAEIQEDLTKVDEQSQRVADEEPLEAWKSTSELLGRRLREQQAALFIVQNQVRLFLIDVTPFDIDEETAVEMALANRLDLMNLRGQTMDAWRGVELAADALESDLDVSLSTSVGTDPNFQNPVRFDSSESSVQVGVQFDGPLNRFAERNGYRSAQINYQQARRGYMAGEDAIINTIRADLRALRISWLNFQISRQTLIATTRQVDEAEFQLRATTTGDTSATRDLLQALQVLLDAKNGLISSWIDYEIGRMGLFVDLELLYLDSDGTWINSTFNPGVDDASDLDEALPDTLTVPNNDSEERESEYDEEPSGTDDGDQPSLDIIEDARIRKQYEQFFRR